MSQHIDSSPSSSQTAAAVREVRYEYSREFLPIMQRIGCSLLVSTYQAGKVVGIGTNEEGVTFSFHNFEQAMGVALGDKRIAIGGRREIWFLHNAHELASRIEPAGRHDACWLARTSFVTGNIHGHEMAWSGDELWVVNTLFSSLCTLHSDFSFVPRWRPKFITALAAEDRCHLNGLTMQNGRPAYVTAMSETDEAGGWRPNKASGGVVIDVPSGETVARGFSMPHSPRLHGGRLWVLDSGQGQLVAVDPNSGKVDVVESLPGYTRGLAFNGQFAFVGLSKIREQAVFGGVPIAERRDELKCGVAVIDLRSGQSVAYLEFLAGVDEVFDVQVLPDTRCPAICGPNITQDDTPETWVVPRDDQVDALVNSNTT